MLTVAKISRSSAAGYADYLDGKARASELGDYYLKDGERTEAPGRWVQGAEAFGLKPGQPVTPEQLHALMAVRRPDGGGELRRVGGSGEAVAALDATFSAPKSVSAVWALVGPKLRERIEQAHETAVDRALGYASRQVAMLRRRVGPDTVIHEKASSVVATSWRHSTARAVGQQVPDPQLHSHVLLHAAVRPDGRLVAIDSRAWLVHQREVGAAYRTELAREMAELGFQIRRGTGRGGRYFELDGVPHELLDRWSSRHHQVQVAIRERLTEQERSLRDLVTAGGPGASEAAEHLQLLERFGQLSPKEERMMATATRATKTPITAEDLDRQWQHTAAGLGVGVERIEVLRHQPHRFEPAAALDVLDGLTEFDATFPAREARAVALERSAGAPIDAALEQLRDLRERDEILVLADGTGTTREHRARERAVVAITERLTSSPAEPLASAEADAQVDRLDRELAQTGGRLSEEQRRAIELGCGGHRLVVIEGQAGTGKSTTLTGIARAHEACGREIIVTSTASLAAQRLATELADHGVSCTAFSTVGLQRAIDRGRLELTPETTVIHDEAALASTREQLQLLRAVESSGARLIEVGDPRQNQPVGAGGLWTHIEHTTRDHAAHVELTVNQRARDPADRQAQAWFREGETELAIRSYAARNRLHMAEDQRAAEDQALEAAHTDRARGQKTIVIAQTSNEHLDQLNARAQAIRQQRCELGDVGIELAGRPYNLHAGDEIQIRHTIPHPDTGQLRNGTTAQVSRVDPDARQVELELGDGTNLQLNGEQIDQADLRLAYVQHPFPAQGHTTDTAHLIVAEHPTQEGTYVALTRARQQTHLYASQPNDLEPDIDRLQELAQRVSRTEPDLPSIHSPLAHETTVVRDAEISQSSEDLSRSAAPDGPDRAAPERQGARQHREPPATQTLQRQTMGGDAESDESAPRDVVEGLDIAVGDDPEVKRQPSRPAWPRPAEQVSAPDRGIEPELPPGWEL